MNFSAIFQLRTKKFWWMDVIFYFVMSLLVATVLCYLIFLTKNIFQKNDIQDEIAALDTVGTAMQKEQEKQVISYQKKIKDFSNIFKNHGFAAQVFYFLQQETRPNVWFERFGLRRKEAVVELTGESDDNESFSRQVAAFEKNEYVKNVNLLNSERGKDSTIKFNLTLSLDSKIFSYIPDLNPELQATETVSPSGQPVLEGQEGVAGKSSEKLIIIFKFPQLPQASSSVDLKNNTVSLGVPFGTDVAKLTPSIVISPKAKVLPESDVPQDFSKPVTYKVTAEDGTTQDYVVSVKVLPKGAEKPSQSNLGIILISVLLVLVIAGAVVGAFLWYRKRARRPSLAVPENNNPKQ